MQTVWAPLILSYTLTFSLSLCLSLSLSPSLFIRLNWPSYFVNILDGTQCLHKSDKYKFLLVD